MKVICKLFVAIVLLFVMPSNASADVQYKYKEVYATIDPNTDLNMRQGPGKDNKLVERLKGGSTLTIVNLDTYDKGWVYVKSPAGNTGYVARKYLRGNYVEQFNSRELEPVAEEKTSNVLDTLWVKFLDYIKRICKWLIGLGWWAYVVDALALALAAGIVRFLRSYDIFYDEPWIHYLVYFITILPTVGLYAIFNQEMRSSVMSDNILLFLFFFAQAIMAVNAGWGVRECGMRGGIFHKNTNRQIGQMLQFPVWVMITLMFYETFLNPLIQYTEYAFKDYDGGFWLFLLGLAITIAIIFAVMYLWMYVIRRILNIAGNWPIRLMTIVLWWTIANIAYNWAYENFDGLGYILVLFFGGVVVISFLFNVLSLLHEIRCPMCHNCDAEQTNLTDHGVSYSTSTGWRSMGDSSITPRNSGAEVSNAQRLVRTTVATHSWTTEHTCPRCGCKWDISHSQEVGRSERELKRSWNETY